MTDESLNPNDQEADAARSSLVDAIHAAENGEAPVRARENAEERQAEADEDGASSAAQEAENARLALQAALRAAETAAAEAEAARADAAVAEEAAEADSAMTEVPGMTEAPEVPAMTEAPQVPPITDAAIVAELPAHEEAEPSDGEHEGIDQMIESLDETAADVETATESEAVVLEETGPEADAAAEPTQPDASDAQAVEQVLTPAIVMPEEKSAINVALWPFLVYLGTWIVFAGVFIWRFIEVPAEQAVFDQADYGIFVAVAIVLAVTGPVVALATWMTSWGRQGATKGDLLVSALVRGSIVTFGGVSIWWLAYILVDLLRLGRVL